MLQYMEQGSHELWINKIVSVNTVKHVASVGILLGIKPQFLGRPAGNLRIIVSYKICDEPSSCMKAGNVLTSWMTIKCSKLCIIQLFVLLSD
jgi:hypothetical protein